MDPTPDPRALEIRDAACAAMIAELCDAAPDGTDLDAIETFVRGLFASLFAASQQKREPPEVAAPQCGRFSAPQPGGTVTGKTAGIDRKILAILTEVSGFYAAPIAILSGQRSRRAQALALYTNWQSHLRRGKDNAWLARKEALRLQMDERKQEKDRNGFIALLEAKADWSALSRHLTGDEVDLAVTTDPNIIAALATCLNHRQGRNSEGARCHHFDNSKTLWPIPNSTRARWKR